ncbi:hypothetical protein BKA80DRAFT_61893 [Phyllosticta citrichinensis]
MQAAVRSILGSQIVALHMSTAPKGFVVVAVNTVCSLTLLLVVYIPASPSYRIASPSPEAACPFIPLAHPGPALYAIQRARHE